MIINYFSLLPLSSFIAAVILSVYIKMRMDEGELQNTFVKLIVSTGLWGFSHFLVFNSASSEEALKYMWVGFLGAAYASFYYLSFILVYTKNKIIKSKYFFLFHIFPLSLPLADYAVKCLAVDAKPAPWGYIFEWGPLYNLNSLVVISFVIIGLIMMIKHYRRVDSLTAKKQTILIIFGTMFPLFGGIITEAMPAILGIQIIPMTTSLTTCLIIIFTIAITKFNLLSITPAAAADQIIETMSDYLVVTDEDSRIAVVNGAICKAVGADKEELLGKDINSIFKNKIIFSQAATSSTIYGDILNRQGMVIPVEIKVSRLEADNKRHLGSAFIIRDISKINNLINEVEKSQEAIIKKNKELLKILDDFYSLRLKMQKDAKASA